MKIGQDKLSRRRLLGGAAVAGAALPVLHEVIPHRGLHGGVDPAAAQADGHGGGHDVSGSAAAPHPAHSGAVGTVDPKANGFDPQEILRDFDEGRVVNGVREWELVAEEKTIEVAPGVQATTPGRTTAACRARRCGRARASGCGSASRTAGRHPHTIHFHGIHTATDGRGTRSRGGRHRARKVDHLRVRRHALRAPPLPLPLDTAGRAHREGALRRVHHRPEAGPAATPTSS